MAQHMLILANGPYVFEKIVYSPTIVRRVVSGRRSFINHAHFFCYPRRLLGSPESVSYSEKWGAVSHLGRVLLFLFFILSILPHRFHGYIKYLQVQNFLSD